MIPANSEDLNKETPDAVYFYTPAFDPLNNFSAYQVHVWDKTFPTVEHAYQWKKFVISGHPDIAEDILKAGSPNGTKNIADGHKTKITAEWHQRKVAVMEEILRAKTDQHQDVRDALKRSGQRTIAENSPVDGFWGVGPDGQGRNELGKIWMRVRQGLLTTTPRAR